MTTANLTPEAIAEINAGLLKFSNVIKRVLEWHGKLIAIGFDVDDELFMNVVQSMMSFEADLMGVIIDQENQQMTARKAPAKTANMGWTCVPGIH